MVEELITNSGRRFLRRGDVFYSGDGRMRLNPKQFKEWVKKFGGGQAHRITEVSSRFAQMARLADTISRNQI
jgi:hypothetical protein